MVAALVTIEIAVAAAGLFTFVVLYARLSWRGSAEGRHIMFFTAALAVLLAMWLVGRLIGGLAPWIWAVALGALPVAAWWRVFLLWKRQHEPYR